eukprot:6205316-Pleurochrysis_carterae.AAC.2
MYRRRVGLEVSRGRRGTDSQRTTHRRCEALNTKDREYARHQNARHKGYGRQCGSGHEIRRRAVTCEFQ